MTTHKKHHLIRDRDLVAEVEIELSDEAGAWGPTMSVPDALTIDEVRDAMRRGDYEAVRALGRLYRLVPMESDPRRRVDAA